MMDEPDEITVIVKGGDRLYLSGSITHEVMWLEGRKWWQFWKPRLVEKFVSWEERP